MYQVLDLITSKANLRRCYKYDIEHSSTYVKTRQQVAITMQDRRVLYTWSKYRVYRVEYDLQHNRRFVVMGK